MSPEGAIVRVLATDSKDLTSRAAASLAADAANAEKERGAAAAARGKFFSGGRRAGG